MLSFYVSSVEGVSWENNYVFFLINNAFANACRVSFWCCFSVSHCTVPWTGPAVVTRGVFLCFAIYQDSVLYDCVSVIPNW